MRIRVTPTSAAAFEWETDVAQFRVGRGDACALRFQGEAGATVSWEHVEILSNPDGTACVTDLRSSNGTFLDGERIVTQTPIHIGSSIQLGRSGPQLQVLEMTVAIAPAPQRGPAAQPVAPAAQPVAPATPASRVGGDAPAAWFIRHVGPIAAVLVIATLGFVIWRRSPSEPAPPATAKASPAATNPPTESSAETNEADAHAAIKTVAAPAAESPAKTDADPWDQARDRAAAAFRLITVEDPKTQSAWPFAGAVVVGDKVLLTTAGVATELAKFVDRGWGVAVQRPGQQARVPVSDVRVHAAYRQEDAGQQLYFDMGILRTSEAVGEPIALASADELAASERGLPLMCLAVDHTGDPLDRFQQLDPQGYTSKVFAVTSLSPQSGSPRLLHLRGSFTDKASGSPVFDQQGRLVAVYCEPAPPAGSASGDLRLHYAKLIEPQLIELAARGGEDEIWVRPQPPATSNETQEPPK